MAELDGKELRKKMNRKGKKTGKIPIDKVVNIATCGGEPIKKRVCNICGLRGKAECLIIR